MTTEESLEIISAINTGQIFKMNRQEIERFVLLLSTPDAHTNFGVSQLTSINSTVKSALQSAITNESIKSHENTVRELSREPNNRQWYEKPIGIIFITAIGAVLAGAIFWNIYHYLHLRLN